MRPIVRGVQVAAWLVASAWLLKLLAAARGLPTLPNLTLPQYDLTPPGNPGLTVIVPARDEAADIEESLGTLLAQDYPNLQIIAVDDRSTDSTGAIMDRLAAEHSGKLRVLHVTALPSGWLGKTHAMALAAALATTDFLLFTDADVRFRRDTLRRSLALAETVAADHLITMPTTLVHRWDEDVLLGHLQILGLWAIPLWRVSVPGSRHALGFGAFNLIRRSAYESVGGFEALRLEIVEDLAMGRRLKRSGFRQQVALGRDLVRLHWASGAPGIVRVMTKNAFASLNYNSALVLGACGGLSVLCIAPFVGLFSAATRLPAFLTVTSNLLLYRLMRPFSGLYVKSALLAPFAAATCIYALLRSAITTLQQGGVIWRGTFYRLAELKRIDVPRPVEKRSFPEAASR